MENPSDVELHINALLTSLPPVQDKLARAKALGEAGSYLRMLGKLNDAERCLEEAVELLQMPSDDVRGISDFILQHAGKNYFDQGEYIKALAAFEKALHIRMNNGSSADLLDSPRHSVDETQSRIKYF